ncbi:MAG: thioredoxin domain-containing protein [Bacteroidota bacterium]
MSNRLAKESSPYLLQHANNPVDWYPWGDEALQRAQAENKLLLVSVGYAACHWCHVMERESFEDESVAAIMNEHFVCVKVDREERPDVDKIYMDAVMLMTQRGGWPLNAIALPDGRPIYGGTYFPKQHWVDVLQQISALYREQPQRTLEYADDLVAAMQKMDVLKPKGQVGFLRVDLQQIRETWMGEVDFKWGGRNVQANKFPLPANNLFLLRAAHLMEDAEMLDAATITLDKMAHGGIYDHLGGGFARYSVDAYWKVPHFEKMLYDNGQLISLYAEAFLKTANPRYKEVVYQTIEFCERELGDAAGGFYSSIDADSEGVEGKFYTWTHEEVEAVLGEEAQLFANYYNIHPIGNWEQTNVLFVLESEGDFARRWNLDTVSFREKMALGRQQLLAAREARIRPGLDDKILTSWNGLMLRGLADAYLAFGEEAFLTRAIRLANFLRENLSEGGQLFRNYKAGKRSINAFLDDYANLIQGYISLYQATFDEQWLQQADLHLQYVLTHFSEEESGMFFFTSDEDPVLVRRKMERQDDVIPASNSQLAQALHTLGLLLDQEAYRDRSLEMLKRMKSDLVNSPGWHANWAQLLLRQLYPHFEVAITGPEAANLRQALIQRYHPNRVFAGAASASELPLLQDRFQDQSTIFVCEGFTCQLPVHSVEAAIPLFGKDS